MTGHPPSNATVSAVGARPRGALGQRSLAIALGVAVVATAARFTVPLPFSPVPMTLSPLAVLLVGGILGARDGSAALVAYLALGMMGLPIFAEGGGVAYILGPTGGYLLAYPVAAGIAGWLARRGGVGPALAAAAAGTVVIHLGGFAQLSILTGDPAAAMRLGLLPFLAGDVVKIVLAGGGIAGLGPVVRRLR